MDLQHSLTLVLAIFPILLGLVWKVSQVPFLKLNSMGLKTIIALSLFVIFAVETAPSTSFLVFAVLLAGFCFLLCQEESAQSSENCHSSMVILGMSLGALLCQGFVSRIFLCALLAYAAFSLIREKTRSLRTTLILIHLIIAIILSFSSPMGGGPLQKLASLFLAFTFLPLVPFHLPFVGIIRNAKGGLSSFWIVVWLALGLAELNNIYTSLSDFTLYAISLLAIISALYSTLAALGQKQCNLFIAAATVAHVSLLWGLLNVFPQFPKWGFAFGIAVGLVLGGISLAFSFVRQRYGWQTIGKLPGLASPMPRLGTLMVLLVSIALFLPTLPTFTGLAVFQTSTLDVNFVKIFFLFVVVWLGGGWFFLQMLHQTAFGTARSDVPYSDLRANEFVAVNLLLMGAFYSGVLY